MIFRQLFVNRRGASALEFALVAPIFVFMLIGISQFGILFFANAGLNNALAEGARFATLYPQPDETSIKTKIQAEKFGLKTANLTIDPFVYGTANSSPYAEITMRYSLQLNFVFFDTGPTTLTESRRVYLQPTAS